MKSLLPLAALSALLLLTACEEDSEDTVDSLGRLSGTLELEGPWPLEGEIQISLFSHWNTDVAMSLAPGGPPDFHTEALLSETPTALSHSIDWSIEAISPGDYSSLVVGWRNGGTLGLDEPVLGMHGAAIAQGDTLPETITIQAGQDLQLDLQADLGLIPVGEIDPWTVHVTGSVEFPGDWPTGYASGVYVLLMSSGDPALPSMPQRFVAVTEEEPGFVLEVESEELHYNAFIAVYGYPYDFADPAADFYGGYGWNWSEGEPMLQGVSRTPAYPDLEGIVISCRPQE